MPGRASKTPSSGAGDHAAHTRRLSAPAALPFRVPAESEITDTVTLALDSPRSRAHSQHTGQSASQRWRSADLCELSHRRWNGGECNAPCRSVYPFPSIPRTEWSRRSDRGSGQRLLQAQHEWESAGAGEPRHAGHRDLHRVSFARLSAGKRAEGTGCSKARPAQRATPRGAGRFSRRRASPVTEPMETEALSLPRSGVPDPTTLAREWRASEARLPSFTS